jgi:hypothetical protein
MKKIIPSNILLFLFSIINVYSQAITSQPDFRSPVDFTIYLSANFGEIRKDHFHSGIDIKTQGSTGKKIFSVADGYISRISVSPNGFGKAVYLTHPNGYETVYAHLSEFIPEIEEFVKKDQYSKKIHYINLFPQPDLFPVKKGEIIGLSGNTGSSEGPHLHFEVRNAKNEHPINPLLFNFEIEDNMNPTIVSLFIYPLSKNSRVNDQNVKKRYLVKGNRGKYTLISEQSIEVWGKIGFGIETLDYLNNSWNKCGVYSIEVLIDNEQIFYHEMDEFSFSETRYVNSFIDYEEKLKNNLHVHRTFVAPNNKLSIYKALKNKGIVQLTDKKIHKISIIVKDVLQNTSTLQFRAKSSEADTLAIKTLKSGFSKIMPYDTDNNYIDSNIKITIPKGSLYDTLYFSYMKTTAIPGSYSQIHYVHDRFTPVHKPFTLWIRPDSVPTGFEENLLIASVNEENEITSVGGAWDGEGVEVQTIEFGKFIVVADTLSPEIKPINIKNNSDLSGKNEIRFIVTDNLSGIRSYNGFIDNNWVLFEFDPKNNLVFYSFDEKRLEKEKNHELILTITDRKDNISVYYAKFYW